MPWPSLRNQGLLVLTGCHCTARLQLFLRWRHGEGRTYGMSHCVCTMAQQTVGDSCRQRQRESELQRQCFQTAGLQMSQWRPSRSVEQEPMGLIVGHSWSACLNSVKSPRQTQATHLLCVTRCPPDQSVASTPDMGSNTSLFACCLKDLPHIKKQYVQCWWVPERVFKVDFYATVKLRLSECVESARSWFKWPVEAVWSWNN